MWGQRSRWGGGKALWSLWGPICEFGWKGFAWISQLVTTETNSSRPRWPLAFELASRCGQHLQRSRTRVLQAFTVLRTQYNSGVPLPYRLGCSDSCVVPTLQPSIQSSKSSPPLGRCIFIFRVSCTMGSPPPNTSVGCHYAVNSTRPGEQYRWGPGHENELPARLVQEHFDVCLFEQLQAALSQGSIDRDWQAVLQTTEARGCNIPPVCRSNCRSLTTSRVKPRTVGPNLTEVAFSPRAQPRSAAELLACTPQISTLPSRARERPALFPAVPHTARRIGDPWQLQRAFDSPLGDSACRASRYIQSRPLPGISIPRPALANYRGSGLECC